MDGWVFGSTLLTAIVVFGNVGAWSVGGTRALAHLVVAAFGIAFWSAMQWGEWGS